MDLKFDSLNLLESMMESSKKCVKTRTEILKYLCLIMDYCSANTAEQKLAEFESIIYYAHAYLINPVFEVASFQSRIPSDSMMQIHCLMFRFLHEKFPQIMNVRNEKNSDFSIYGKEFCLPYFSWNIPSVFMPFLAAYIGACSVKHKEALTPDLFFENLSSAFDTALHVSQTEEFSYTDKDLSSQMERMFQEWCDMYLGRSYFTNLAKLLKDFSGNKENERRIEESIQSITNVLLFAPLHPNPIPYYANLLLEKHIEFIHSHDSQELFPHLEPWKINGETDFVHDLVKSILDIANLMRDFVLSTWKDHHNSDSRYKLAVKDYPAFEKAIGDCLQFIPEMNRQAHLQLKAFFDQSNSFLDVESAVEKGRLSVSVPNEQKHIEVFTKSIEKYMNDVSEEINTFLKLVKHSSASHPENYKKIKLDSDFLSDFIDNFSKITKNFKNRIDNKLQHLPAPFTYHAPGLIQQNSYGLYFSEQDILKILSIIITESPASLLKQPADSIIDKLTSMGFHIPLSSLELASLFLRLEELCDNSRTNPSGKDPETF